MQRPGGAVGHRGATIVTATRDGRVGARAAPADRTRLSFPLRKDGGLVIDREPIDADSCAA